MKPPYRFEKLLADMPMWSIRSRQTGEVLCFCADQQLCEAIYRLGREAKAEDKQGRR